MLANRTRSCIAESDTPQAAAAAEPVRAALIAALRPRRIQHVDELVRLPALRRRSRWRTAEHLARLRDIVALPNGWIGSLAPTRGSQLDTTLRLMFAVNPALHIAPLNEGLRRGMAARGLTWRVPDDVLLAYLQHRQDVTVNGDFVTALQPPDVDVIPPMQRQMLTAVRRSPTRVLRYHDIVEAYTAAGGSAGAAQVHLARSPILQRVGRGLYAARGDHVAPANTAQRYTPR